MIFFHFSGGKIPAKTRTDSQLDVLEILFVCAGALHGDLHGAEVATGVWRTPLERARCQGLIAEEFRAWSVRDHDPPPRLALRLNRVCGM